MKRFVVLVSVGLALASGRPAAADSEGALVGALIGAGTGLVLANNMHGVNRAWAVPVLAIGGGIIGNQIGQRLDACDAYGNYQPVVYGPGAQPAAAAQPVVRDLHPGVDLIKVSILNSNGMRTDVNILRVKDKFIGPQGETYDSLPTSEMLAQKYGM